MGKACTPLGFRVGGHTQFHALSPFAVTFLSAGRHVVFGKVVAEYTPCYTPPLTHTCPVNTHVTCSATCPQASTWCSARWWRAWRCWRESVSKHNRSIALEVNVQINRIILQQVSDVRFMARMATIVLLQRIILTATGENSGSPLPHNL